MPRRSRGNQDRGNLVLAGLIGLAVLVYAVQSYRKRHGEVNPHDASVGRIDAFELRAGEVAVAVRVRHDGQPVRAADVWAQRGQDDGARGARFRRGQTDAGGLVRVPVPQGGGGSTRLFARDAAGRVGSGFLTGDQMLSAPDIVLVEVAPRGGRLLSSDGAPLAGARVTAESFSSRRPSAEGGPTSIEIPEPVRPDYAVPTDAEGRFSVPGVPVGYDCRLAFQTSGHGEGRLALPADSPGECRLSPAGGVRVQVAGEGTAGDVRGLRCRLITADASNPGPESLHLDGGRTVRHDGTAAFAIGNVIPGPYRVQLEGTPRNPVLPEQSVSVTVVSGETAAVSVPLKRAGRVTGRAVDGKSGRGLGDVDFGVFTALGGDSGYGGRVTTDRDGRFSAYVPAGVPVTVLVDECPPGYATPRGRLAALFADAKPVTAAADETVTLPDTKLYTRGTISGVVVADGKPVAGATVEIGWDRLQNHKAVTLQTDAAGRFAVADAPPGQPATLRVRAGDRVNAAVVLSADELVGPLTVPVAAANAFRVRGRLTDVRGGPVERARVVVTGAVRTRPPAPPAAGEQPPQAFIPTDFGSVELEAVFTDAAGRFESGPLWPGCHYSLSISRDGLVPRRLEEIEGQPGQVHEVPTVHLRGQSTTVAGIVVGPDGAPLAGATVINSGDGPKRVTATTDAAGRFALTGLYEGQAVVVAHKAGHRWGYGVARPGEAEPRIVLRRLSDPPAAIPPLTEEHRQAEAALVRRLNELAEKQRAAAKQASEAEGRNQGELDKVRKDLDAYLAAHAKRPVTVGTSDQLVSLARALAGEDPAKARRLLQEAAAAARQASLPSQPGLGSLMPAEMGGMIQALEMIRVAEAAADLGVRDQAVAWLAEAESRTGKLPAPSRRQPLETLAVAWVTLDPARTEKLLAALDGDRDGVILQIIVRLLRIDVRQALPWLDRLQRRHEPYAERTRAEVARRLAALDFAQARRLAEGIEDPVARGQTCVRLAAVAHKTDADLARTPIDQAAAALVVEAKSDQDDRESRLGLASSLLGQAKAVGYADLASVVAMALTSREPLRADAHLDATWARQTVQLAAVVASVDPAAGRSLLGPDGELARVSDSEDSPETWLTALALTDPAAALRRLDSVRGFNPASVLAVLRKRSTVGRQLGLDRGWATEAEEAGHGTDTPNQP